MLTVEIHSLKASTTSNVLPSQISRIRDLLDIPLPSWCSSGPSELSGVPPKPSDILGKDNGLEDLYELASHTFTVVNSAIRCRAPIWPFVRGFTKILGTIHSEDATILSRTPFVRPRKTPPDDKFDGIAELLVCHVVAGFGETNEKSVSEGAAHPLSHSNTSPKESTESRGEPDDPGEAATQDGNSEDPAEDDSDKIVDFQSSQSSDSGPSIDVSLDGHIFPGCGKHTDALLPILCVADAENILDLMTSVACQRFVWGISEPAIGFAISSSGAVMEFVVSWVDKSTRVVHAAHNIGCPGLASFDFRNFTAILRFSQFICLLSPSFHGVASDVSPFCQNNKLYWRSENPKFSDARTGLQRVSQWVRNVQLSSYVTEQSVPVVPVVLESAQLDSMLTKSVQTFASHNDASSKSSGNESLGVSTQSMFTSPSQAGSGRISSSFETGYEMAPDIYAFERRVRSVIFFDHPAENFGDEGIEINAKMEMYTTMTAFQWFPPSNKDPFPNVNGLLLAQKNTLLDQASEFSQSSRQSPSLLSFLKPQHQTVIQRQIYILLYSSPKIRRATSKLQGGESNHWDTLLFCFYIDNQEILSPTVLLEPTIHYSRNIFADETDPAQLAALVKEEIESNMKFCGQAELAAMAHGHSTSWRDEASSAHDRAFRLMCSYVDYLRTTDGQQPLHHLIQDRSRHEAKEGTCGAICCLMVPLPHLVRLADISAFQSITRVRDGITRGAIAVQGSLTTGKDEDSETRFKEEVTEQGRVRDSERNLLGSDTKPKSITTLCHSGSGATAQPIIPEFEPSVFDDKLLFPHLLVQNKKTDETETTAISQGRVRLLSMISFYAALGIVDRPFYALITNGPEGTVLMGWQSKRVKRTYLFEKNVVKFNIGTALGAYHFAIFLLRLREEQTDLAKLIESKLTGRHFNFEQLLSWRKESQVPR